MHPSPPLNVLRSPRCLPFFFFFFSRLLYLLKLHHGLSCAQQDGLCVLEGGGAEASDKWRV